MDDNTLARIFDEFIDRWVLLAIFMPTNNTRHNLRQNTIRRLQRLIDILQDIEFDSIMIAEEFKSDN